MRRCNKNSGIGGRVVARNTAGTSFDDITLNMINLIRELNEMRPVVACLHTDLAAVCKQASGQEALQDESFDAQDYLVLLPAL